MMRNMMMMMMMMRMMIMMTRMTMIKTSRADLQSRPPEQTTSTGGCRVAPQRYTPPKSAKSELRKFQSLESGVR